MRPRIREAQEIQLAEYNCRKGRKGLEEWRVERMEGRRNLDGDVGCRGEPVHANSSSTARTPRSTRSTLCGRLSTVKIRK